MWGGGVGGGGCQGKTLGKPTVRCSETEKAYGRARCSPPLVRLPPLLHEGTMHRSGMTLSFILSVLSYAESAYIDLAAAAQCTKVDEEKAVGLDNNQRGGSISDGCSDSGDSLDDHRNPKAKKTRHKGRGNANR